MIPLESEEKWNELESKFINFLSTLIGVNLVPLSYVMRVNNNTDSKVDFSYFIDKPISCAPLNGEYYESGYHTDLHKSIEAL